MQQDSCRADEGNNKTSRKGSIKLLLGSVNEVLKQATKQDLETLKACGAKYWKD